MSYTRNFGFRSFENIVRAGRFRTPATGDAMEIGVPVVANPATGEIDLADGSATKPLGGVLVYEHIQKHGFDPDTFLPTDAHTVPLGVYAQIVRGPGVKVWLKNTADVTLIAGTDPAAGEYLIPGSTGNAGKWVKEADLADAWLVVEKVTGAGATLCVEARFVF